MIRVIYKDQTEVMPTAKALALAKSVGLDLVEIAENSDPPVCRIVDYGKYKYDQAKKKSARPSHKSKLKEIQLRVRIDTNDYRVKMARAEGFLDQGDKLTVKLRFRGRENAHRELGFQLMLRVQKDLETMAKVDAQPRQVGRGIVMMLSPLPKSERKRHFLAEHQSLEDIEDTQDDEDSEDLEDHDDHEDDTEAENDASAQS